MSRFPAGVRFEYVECHPSNFTRGNWRKDFIVLHWWNDPKLKPQFGGVVAWFQNPTANVSIQYVVEGGRITQMIPESAQAWHSGNTTGNRHGIGIEVNPRLSDEDYETTAQLVAEIWSRRGVLPLRAHREFTTTSCPGVLDIKRVERRAHQIRNGATVAGNVTAPTKPARVEGIGPNRWPNKPLPVLDAAPGTYWIPPVGFRNVEQVPERFTDGLSNALTLYGYPLTGNNWSARVQQMRQFLRNKAGIRVANTWSATFRGWQRYMKSQGLYNGAIDGYLGPQSIRATTAWLRRIRPEFIK